MRKINTIGNNVYIVATEIVVQLGGRVARDRCQTKTALMVNTVFQNSNR